MAVEWYEAPAAILAYQQGRGPRPTFRPCDAHLVAGWIDAARELAVVREVMAERHAQSEAEYRRSTRTRGDGSCTILR